MVQHREGHWVDKRVHEDHECDPPSTLCRDYGPGSLWECWCGQQWRFSAYVYWEKWEKH